jgi:xanthine dehydrogenase YagR molybdenum-binding subunit
MQNSLHGSTNAVIGEALSRVDGRVKVTGKAMYAAETQLKNMAYGVIVQSTIARGSVASIDTSAAESAPGVLVVITPKNMPKLRTPKPGTMGEERMPLSDMTVHFVGQHLAVVVADSLARASYAATLVKVGYSAETPRLSAHDQDAQLTTPKTDFGEPIQITRGDVESAASTAGMVVVKQTYRTPIETHNPMEPSATTALWETNGHLTVWNSTQDVSGTKDAIAEIFSLKPENVRVFCPYTGGGFGCKGSHWPHTTLAIAAAKMTKRPVKLALTRPQMFTSCGHRPATEQTMTLVAAKDGKLAAIGHESLLQDSPVGAFVETCGMGTSYILYNTPNLKITHSIRRINIASPTFMRAPGETPGSFALESAMDELAYELNMDPVQLRLANYAEKQPQTGQPWSSKHLRECYETGMQKFGWANRDAKVGSMRTPEGRLMGWGMSSAAYPAMTFPGTARIRLMSDGRDGVLATGAAATQDLGTGTWTIGQQITASQVGLPLQKVRFDLGDSNLPSSGVSGGSATAASITLALSGAARSLKAELLKVAAADPNSPLAGLTSNEVSLEGNRLVSIADSSRFADVNGLIVRSGRPYIEGLSTQAGKDSQAKVKTQGESSSEDYEANQKTYAFHSFGAHFVQVVIDEPVPLVRVTRVVSVMDVGKIINPKTAVSQINGGVTMGMGAALMEETLYDPISGRPVTNNLADYAVCVNPDVHTLETYFTDIPDVKFNSLGCRGVGEIGITGVSAAIANAVYHATGKRIRELPITPDKLI